MSRPQPRPPGTHPPAATYNRAIVAPRVLEIIAQGGTWARDIETVQGLPTQKAFWKWCQEDADLQMEYEAAQRHSARVAAEKAQGMADQLARMEVPKDQVRAFEVAMGQYRWWAERSDPARWGQRPVVAPAAAIQIVTNVLGNEREPQVITIEATNPRSPAAIRKNKENEVTMLGGEDGG